MTDEQQHETQPESHHINSSRKREYLVCPKEGLLAEGDQAENLV
jgi:hypothetical protein